jgi:hypothetical protein
MHLDERIQKLCSQVVAEKDPEKLAALLSELREALREHQRGTGAMVFRYRKLLKEAA